VLSCGNRLQVVLGERRLSQADLAVLTSLPYTTILRVTRPRGNPLLEHALRISAALDTPVEDLFWYGNDGSRSRASRSRTSRWRHPMLQYALLWLLHEQRDYGYRLKRRFEERMGDVWLLNIGQVYQTLQRLRRAGLVTVVDGATADQYPARRLFELSPKGERVLARWLRRPPARPRPVRDESMVRLLVVGAGRDGVTTAQIDEQEASFRRHLGRLRAQRARVPTGGNGCGRVRQLGLEAAVLHAEAHLKWLAHCRQHLGCTPEATAERA